MAVSAAWSSEEPDRPRATEQGTIGDAGSLASVPRASILEISAQIDELVEAQLRAHGQQPNPRVAEDVFLRRVYLDIVGRIPTLDETRAYLSSNQPDKRAELIDRLLESDGYVSHQFNFWADLLRIKQRFTGGTPGQPYIDYLHDAIARNKPYDQLVRELITASGPALREGNGATGYYLRDFGMLEDNMSNTVRLFLGTRLECAQCHDHPFDAWTQLDYYRMVAFTGGVRMRLKQPDSVASDELRAIMRDRTTSPELRRSLGQLIRPLTYGVEGSGTGLARLPENYTGTDLAPNQIVAAETMFGHESLVDISIPARRPGRVARKENRRTGTLIPGAQEVDSRGAYARWLTSPENTRFAVVIANRLWKRAMGMGLIEPVDVMDDETKASNPALMDYLAAEMGSLNYDLKQYLRSIYNSQTYQRQATGDDITSPRDYYFPGPLLRRMSAEQLWDSLLTLAVPGVDQRKGRADRFARMLPGKNVYSGYEALRSKSAEELVAMAQRQLQAGAGNKDRNAKQARVQAQRGGDAARQARGSQGTGKGNRRWLLGELRERIGMARGAGDISALRRLMARRAAARQAAQRFAPDLVRASELPQPARAGHLLRDFGQSDREQIDNATFDPAVTQALALMNGFVARRIVRNPRTVLMQSTSSAGTQEEKVEVIFLSMLGRYPSPAEKAVWLDEGQTEGRHVVEDLIWTLANTSEFMFVQ